MFWSNAEGVARDFASFTDLLGVRGIADPGELIGRGINFTLNELRRLGSSVSRSVDRYAVTAFGQPGSNRLDLANVCYKALAQYLSLIDGAAQQDTVPGHGATDLPLIALSG